MAGEVRERRDPVSALVSVGNELLFGETVDTNAAWLGRILSAHGLPVGRHLTVGDDARDIAAAVEASLATADVVVVTGGLGPTRDDRTKVAVADLLGLELKMDPAVLEAVEERFRAAGRTLPESSRAQAEVPRGATALRNPEGTAPGLWLRVEGRSLVLLPGVPRELKAIVDDALLEALVAGLPDGATPVPVHHRVVPTTGIGESRLAERLEPHLIDATDPGIEVAFLPDVRGVDLRLTIRGGTGEEARRRFDRFLEGLEPVLAPWRFEGGPTGDLAVAVADALRRTGRTMATAESCTGGLVAKRMTDVPGASAVFLGGVVAYADEAKIELLGVSPGAIAAHGAVSEPVAVALAEGAARRFGASATVGVTGVAGPEGGSDAKPVGTVWISTCVDGASEAVLRRFPGGREAIREAAAQAALERLYRALLDRPAGG